MDSSCHFYAHYNQGCICALCYTTRQIRCWSIRTII